MPSENDTYDDDSGGNYFSSKSFSCRCGCCQSASHSNSKKDGIAIVFATDVRLASKEQVESLGGKFLIVEGSENLETEGGYAKAIGRFKKAKELLKKL